MVEEEDSQNNGGGTPYDDVFRTMVVECSELVIPVLNEAFGEKYTGNEKIVFHPNEYFLRQQDGQEAKRITDSTFDVIGETKKSYLMISRSKGPRSLAGIFSPSLHHKMYHRCTTSPQHLVLQI